MSIFAAVLNAECAAGTGMFDTATLHTGDPSTTGANEDTGAGEETLTWSSPANGVATATATWSGVTGDWTHIGLWNGSTFVGSVEREISFPTSEDLTVTFRLRVAESV
jgi:hypothetical protein